MTMIRWQQRTTVRRATLCDGRSGAVLCDIVLERRADMEHEVHEEIRDIVADLVMDVQLSEVFDRVRQRHRRGRRKKAVTK